MEGRGAWNLLVLLGATWSATSQTAMPSPVGHFLEVLSEDEKIQ